MGMVGFPTHQDPLVHMETNQVHKHNGIWTSNDYSLHYVLPCTKQVWKAPLISDLFLTASTPYSIVL